MFLNAHKLDIGPIGLWNPDMSHCCIASFVDPGTMPLWRLTNIHTHPETRVTLQLGICGSIERRWLVNLSM